MKKQALLLAAAIASACPAVSSATNVTHSGATLALANDLEGKRLSRFIAWLADYKILPSTLTAQPMRLNQAASFFSAATTQQVQARLLPPKTYTVKSGDYLSAIAAQLAVQGIESEQLAEIIYANNPKAFIRGDKNLLKVGAVLALPLLTKDNQTLISAASSTATTTPPTLKQELQQLKQHLAHSRTALAAKHQENQQLKLLLKQKNRIISKRTKQMQVMEDQLDNTQSVLKIYQSHSAATAPSKQAPVAQGAAEPETQQGKPLAEAPANQSVTATTVANDVDDRSEDRSIYLLGLSVPLLGLLWWHYQSRHKS